MEYTLRVIARAIIFNRLTNSLLLVKNKDSDFWYPPGGGWEYNQETIEECVIREAKEETGIGVNLIKFAYVQEFRNENKKKAMIELFWICEPIGKLYKKNHKDEDVKGIVEISKWFNKEEIQNITVFPEMLKNDFWNEYKNILNEKDRFIRD